MAENGHRFYFENAVDHVRFKGERLVKRALHSELQAARRCLAPGTIPSDPDKGRFKMDISQKCV